MQVSNPLKSTFVRETRKTLEVVKRCTYVILLILANWIKKSEQYDEGEVGCIFIRPVSNAKGPLFGVVHH